MLIECLFCARAGARRTHVPNTANYEYQCDTCSCRYTISVVEESEWWYKSDAARARIEYRIHRECAKGITPHIG